MTDQTLPSPSKRWGRSVLAVVAGFIAVVALSIGFDELFYALHIYPPRNQPMQAPALFALALLQRSLAAVFGGWAAARLAPRAPMNHALIVGAIGLGISTLGAAVTRNMHLGPEWYAIGLMATALPCAWLGGKLHRPTAVLP